MDNENYLQKFIVDYPDYPKKGIVFKDITPIFRDPIVFKNVIDAMSKDKNCCDSDAIIAIDARGFIFGTAIALKTQKPLVLARKYNKLPGLLLSRSYNLEYGKNIIEIQKTAIKKYKSFYIVDDLLATGGTVNCVADILKNENKEITGLSVLVELTFLNGKSKLNFPINSQIKY